MKFLDSLIKGEEGATIVEYALMLALIASALVGTITLLKNAVATKYTNMATSLSTSS